MGTQSWRKEPRKNYSNDYKLRMVELASRTGACVAQLARENGINDNISFKWLRLWQDEGRISRRLPATVESSPVWGGEYSITSHAGLLFHDSFLE